MEKPSKHNVGHDDLSRIKLREIDGNVDVELLDANLYRVGIVQDHFTGIATILTTRKEPKDFPSV